MLSTSQMQQKLKDLGFYTGTVDGIAGPKTSAAIVAFKSSVNLKATDFYGPVTDEALRNAVLAAPAADAPWIVQAKSLLGLKEIAGPKHQAKILEMWKQLGLPYQDDETSWCAAFVGYCLERAGQKSTRSASARSYEKWGQRLSKPVPGAVVVFWRGSPTGWQGHVGFVLAIDSSGRPVVIGGNQGDEVSIKPFDPSRVTGYFWPAGYPVPNATMPRTAAVGASSANEA